jgi:hypothetical protein
MINWRDIFSSRLIAILALVCVFAFGSCSKTELEDVKSSEEQVLLKETIVVPNSGIGDNGGDDDQDKDDNIGDNGGDDDQDKDDAIIKSTVSSRAFNF